MFEDPSKESTSVSSVSVLSIRNFNIPVHSKEPRGKTVDESLMGIPAFRFNFECSPSPSRSLVMVETWYVYSGGSVSLSSICTIA